VRPERHAAGAGWELAPIGATLRSATTKKLPRPYGGRENRTSAVGLEAHDDNLAANPALLHILVVEDHEDSRELLAEVLRLTGDHRIALAETAEEGLLYLQNGEVCDLIVTDVGLPQMSGFEMLDRASREGLLPSSVVVVCTANQFLRTEALARGAHYLPKPVDADKLTAIVYGLLGQR
jgi:CheY-like chemotaxis protein